MNKGKSIKALKNVFAAKTESKKTEVVQNQSNSSSANVSGSSYKPPYRYNNAQGRGRRGVRGGGPRYYNNKNDTESNQ